MVFWPHKLFATLYCALCACRFVCIFSFSIKFNLLETHIHTHTTEKQKRRGIKIIANDWLPSWWKQNDKLITGHIKCFVIVSIFATPTTKQRIVYTYSTLRVESNNYGAFTDKTIPCRLVRKPSKLVEINWWWALFHSIVVSWSICCVCRVRCVYTKLCWFTQIHVQYKI